LFHASNISVTHTGHSTSSFATCILLRIVSILNFVIQVVIRTEYDLPERPMFPDTLPDLIRRYTESPLFKRCVGGKELALWWSEIERLLMEPSRDDGQTESAGPLLSLSDLAWTSHPW